jgi:streptogrisin C
MRTLVRCGRILNKNATIVYPDGPVYGLTTTDACADHGDSGGPYMVGDQAQGVLSGITDPCGGSNPRSHFQPINPILSRYSLTLKTA